MQQLIAGKFAGLFSPPAVVFNDVFFPCAPGPPVCGFEPSTRQRERVLWKPCIPCGGVQPQHSQEQGGDGLLPPTRAHRKAGTGALLLEPFVVVWGGSLGRLGSAAGRDPFAVLPVIRGCIRCALGCAPGAGAG